MILFEPDDGGGVDNWGAGERNVGVHAHIFLREVGGQLASARPKPVKIIAR